MSLSKVPLFQNPRGHVQVEQGATKGAKIGVNVWNADGTLFVPAVTSTSSDPTVAVTMWELVLKIPPNIVALAALSTTGYARRNGDGSWIASDAPMMARRWMGF